jgi:hypothetical protein
MPDSAGDESDVERRRRLAAQKRLPRMDQNLAGCRNEYKRLNQIERQEFRQWVEALASYPTLAPPDAILAIHSIVLVVNENCQEDMREIRVSPKLLAKAIKAWDKGEDFSPTDDD